MSSEKQAKELLRQAWIVLDVVEPNNPVTDQALEFLMASETTDLDRLVGWLVVVRTWAVVDSAKSADYKAGKRAAFREVKRHIADEFGVGKAE